MESATALQIEETKSADFYNSVYKHQVSTSSAQPMAFAPWFGCQYGNLVAASGITNSTFYAA